MTRATMTLLGAAAAAFLMWLGVQVIDPLGEESITSGEWWTLSALLAAAGFVIALSQLLGGWTKWGWPRISVPVLVVGFLPAAVVALWVIGYHDPGESELGDRIREWSGDIGVDDTVAELGIVAPVAAFGLGLLFGLAFDTSGPRVREAGAEPVYEDRREYERVPGPGAAEGLTPDDEARVTQRIPGPGAAEAVAPDADTRVVQPSEQETRVVEPSDDEPPHRET